MHVFAVGFPAWLATAALATRTVRTRPLLFGGGGLLAFLLFVMAFYAATDSDFALPVFLDVLHDRQEPTAYGGVYWGLLTRYGDLVAALAGIPLVYLACLGALVVLYPLAVWLGSRARALQRIDVFPAFLLAAYLAMMLTAPIDKHRDSTEFTVRREGEVWRVRGNKPERWVRQTDFSNDEAVGFLADRLARLGVEDRLLELGATPGEPVAIGAGDDPVVFDFDPGVEAGAETLLGRRGSDLRLDGR